MKFCSVACRMKFPLVRSLYPLLLLLVLPCLALADPVFREPSSREFVPSPALQGKVEFWVRIFSKFGKENAVFHYRDHPEIVYSVLDFSELSGRFSDRELARAKARALQEETARIDGALASLAAGNKPRNEFESRIHRVFEGVLGKGTAKFQKAREADQIRSQTGIRERFEQAVKRSGQYLYLIEDIFQAEGLPWEITRLPYVESSFDYTAYSSVGAAGIWQFMPATARKYMRVTSSIDERRDPIIATRAAAQYLKHAKGVLKRWPLALTSYNHGVTGVLRGVKATGSYDLEVLIEKYNAASFGFASKNFFASFLAALEVDRNWRNYFPGLVKDEPWYFDEVRLERAMSISEVSRIAGMSRDDFADHNLALLKPVVKNRVPLPAGFVIKVPRGRGVEVASRLRGGRAFAAAEPTSRQESAATASGGSYTVRPNDTLGKIARSHKVSVKELMAANGISDPRRVRAGKKLVIPGAEKSAAPSGTVSGASREYTVVAGDTLSGIARRHGTTISELKRLNPGVSHQLQIKQTLRLPS